MIKVIHLLNHLEKIERDLTEIEELKSRLEQDRTYTSRVRNSLEEETLRLRELQQTIGRLVVPKAPTKIEEDLKHFLVKNSGQKSVAISKKQVPEVELFSPKVDIILPTNAVEGEEGAPLSKKPFSKKTVLGQDSSKPLSPNRKDGVDLDAGAGQSNKAAKAVSPQASKRNSGRKTQNENEDPPFRWKFVQN